MRTSVSAAQHVAFAELAVFVESFELAVVRCLEVGRGRGLFQDLVADWTGVDLSESVRSFVRKPFYACSATGLPFEPCSFDAIWSITVLEHIPEPELALSEMRRVLKPGGLLFLKPTWHCRPWICEGIPVRPFSDLSLRQRWIKATLPIRDSLLLRAAATLPQRILHWLRAAAMRRPISLTFRTLPANYDTFWMADSDAAVALDPFDVILWFRDRGDDVLSHPKISDAFTSRSESLIIRKSAGERPL